MRRSSRSPRARLSASRSSARAAPPAASKPAPVVLEVAPDRSKRLSGGALVEASIAARLLGMRILTLEATVAVVPAAVAAATPALQDGAAREGRAGRVFARPSRDRRGRSGSLGPRLADAVRNLDEGAELLVAAKRKGA